MDGLQEEGLEVPEMVDMHVYHGGEFIDDFEYVGGEKFMLKDMEWVLAGDTDMIGAGMGYDKVVKSGVRINGSKVFTFLPEDYNLAANIIEKGVDVKQRCVNLYIEAKRDVKGKGKVSESEDAFTADIQEDRMDLSDEELCLEETIEAFDSESVWNLFER